MRLPLLMPKLGLTMTEGSVMEWSVAVGAARRQGEPLFVVETDKVATEICAEQDGTLVEIVVPVGETVPVSTVLGYWEVAVGTPQAIGPDRSALAEPLEARRVASTAPAAATPSSPSQRLCSTPYARRLARERGVSLHWVRGSGPRGRIRAVDVPQAEAALTLETSVEVGGVHGHWVEPAPMQVASARRLTQAKQSVPHFYLALEVEVTALLALHAQTKCNTPAVGLTLTHCVIAAAGRALLDVPAANRIWLDERILALSTSAVGVAVAGVHGLLVPVVQDVGGASLAEVARRARRMVERARAGQLDARELAGGAITVSNAGMHNVTYLTPIINPGQAMILGVGSVRELFRPDAAGLPHLQRELGLVLACDHRVIDGVGGLQYLNRVAELLRDPTQLVDPRVAG